MKQLQFYKYATIGLLLLNLGMLTFFFLTKPKHHSRKDFKRGAVDILKLDDEQRETFFNLVKGHQQKMKVFSQHQKELLSPYFNSLIDSTEVNQDVFDKVEELERQKIESIYQHFQEIKSILREEQMPGFEEFMNHVMKRILSNSERKPPPPKGRNK